MTKSIPRIAILMATYNGKRWLSDQVSSILLQEAVNLKLFVSDDNSSDGTLEYLNQIAYSDSRVIVMPQTERVGSAGKNFYRLVCDVDINSFDYVAFADQDDLWDHDKLSRHVKLIQSENAECISSNVIAFWPDGSQRLICKSQPQMSYDFIFESAGPGCSFLMTLWLFDKLRNEILAKDSPAKNVLMHDWLTYAICRAYERRWFIDSCPSLLYRQHANNVIGANSGIKAIIHRLRMINDGWYRCEVSKICDVAARISRDPRYIKLSGLLKKRTLLSQLQLILYAFSGRRNLRDRFVLILSILAFIF
jgi:rhamnosyltransferase